MLMVPSGRWIRAHELGPKRGVWNYKRPGWTPCERGGGFDCASGSKVRNGETLAGLLHHPALGKDRCQSRDFFGRALFVSLAARRTSVIFFGFFFFFYL